MRNSDVTTRRIAEASRRALLEEVERARADIAAEIDAGGPLAVLREWRELKRSRRGRYCSTIDHQALALERAMAELHRRRIEGERIRVYNTRLARKIVMATARG